MSTTILVGDVRDRIRELADESVHCVVTSPPYYGLRDYGVAGQIGLEHTVDAFVCTMVGVFREVRRVLRADGTLWLNLGDSYAGGGNGARDPERWPKQHRNNNGDRVNHAKRGTGLKDKDLMMVPARVAIALQADGWWLRSDIIWSKRNPMPESVTDRPSVAHEHVFLLTKSARYFYDVDAIRAPQKTAGSDGGSGDRFLNPRGANFRNVWELSNEAFPEAHFATFPQEIPRRCIRAGCPKGGTVLDPFGGSGTTGLVADELERNCILIELNPEYALMAERRIRGASPMFASVTMSRGEVPA